MPQFLDLLTISCFVICTLLSNAVQSFSPTITSTSSKVPPSLTPPSSPSWSSSSSSTTTLYATRERNFLMDDFCTADGKIINPYATLKVDRQATRAQIRTSYRLLSKKYHPDAVRFRKVMPGKCDTLDEVRDEWERIKLSYEILSDKKVRLKYDRQSALNDPGKALGRVAIDTVSWGVTGLAKGIFHAVSAAADATIAATKKKDEDAVDAVDAKASINRNEAIVQVDKRVKRKQRMVQPIALEEQPTSTSDGVEMQHEAINTVNDALSLAPQKGKSRLMPFQSKSIQRNHLQNMHTFDVNGYSSLAIAVHVDSRNRKPILTSIKRDISAIGLTLTALVQDATLSAQDYKTTLDESMKSISDSITVVSENVSPVDALFKEKVKHCKKLFEPFL